MANDFKTDSLEESILIVAYNHEIDDQIKNIGEIFGPDALAARGISAKAFQVAGYLLGRIHEYYSPEVLALAGYAAEVFHDLGYKLSEIHTYYATKTLALAGYSADAFYKLGYKLSEIKSYYNADQLKNAGYAIMDMVINGLGGSALDAFGIVTSSITSGFGSFIGGAIDKIGSFIWGKGSSNEGPDANNGNGELYRYKLYIDIDHLSGEWNGYTPYMIFGYITELGFYQHIHSDDCSHCDNGDNLWVSSIDDREIIGCYIRVINDDNVQLDEIETYEAKWSSSEANDGDQDGGYAHDNWDWDWDITDIDQDFDLEMGKEYWFHWGYH